jgi:hypothetical protein
VIKRAMSRFATTYFSVLQLIPQVQAVMAQPSADAIRVPRMGWVPRRNRRVRIASDGFPKTSAPSSATRFQLEPLNSASALFLNGFDLLVDYLSGEPVDRNMHPVTLLTFNNNGRKARVRSRELKSDTDCL